MNTAHGVLCVAEEPLYVVASAKFNRQGEPPKKGPGSLSHRKTDQGNATERRLWPPKLMDLRNTTLGTSDRAVWGALCDHGNVNYSELRPEAPAFDGFAAWPSRKTIAEIANLSLRGVDYALEHLQAANVIRCIYKAAGGDPRDTSVYLLTPHLIAASFIKLPKTKSNRPEPVHSLQGSDTEPVHSLQGSDTEPVHSLQGSDTETRALTAGDPCSDCATPVHSETQTRAVTAPDLLSNLQSKSSSTNTSNISEEEVTRALLRFGPPDPTLASQLIAECRGRAPDCTESEVLHFIAQKGPLAKQSPGGFLLTAVPRCFEGNAFREYRRKIACSRGLKAGEIE